jgi:hypothetical protein
MNDKPYKCANHNSGCPNMVAKSLQLCPDCRRAAAELQKRIRSEDRIDETLQALETKPRSWRDVQ